jgi:hypothetical protein
MTPQYVLYRYSCNLISSEIIWAVRNGFGVPLTLVLERPFKFRGSWRPGRVVTKAEVERNVHQPSDLDQIIDLGTGALYSLVLIDNLCLWLCMTFAEESLANGPAASVTWLWPTYVFPPIAVAKWSWIGTIHIPRKMHGEAISQSNDCFTAPYIGDYPWLSLQGRWL